MKYLHYVTFVRHAKEISCGYLELFECFY